MGLSSVEVLHQMVADVEALLADKKLPQQKANSLKKDLLKLSNFKKNFTSYEQADKVVLSISGGKDSSVLMQWAVDRIPKEKLICVHAEIDIDWKETIPIVKQQCEHFGLPLVIVKAVDKDGQDKGFLSQLLTKRKDRKTGELKETKFPDMGNRWCTSVLKIGPIDKYVRTLRGNVLVLLGERREESPKRAVLNEYRPDLENTIEGRYVVKFSPILDLSVSEVWKIISDNKLPVHPCYGWGVSRASCAICIFSSAKEIVLAKKHAPEIVEKYMETEKQISHSFKYKPATKKRAEEKLTIRDILEKEGAL